MLEDPAALKHTFPEVVMVGLHIPGEIEPWRRDVLSLDGSGLTQEDAIIHKVINNLKLCPSIVPTSSSADL